MRRRLVDHYATGMVYSLTGSVLGSNFFSTSNWTDGCAQEFPYLSLDIHPCGVDGRHCADKATIYGTRMLL